MLQLFVILCSLIILVTAQRPSFAGNRPASGYKDGLLPQNSNGNNIESRFTETGFGGGRETFGMEPNLPYDARGDAYLVNYWNSVPFEQRPYWIVNQQHIEAQRNTPPRNPSTVSSAQITKTPNILNVSNLNGRINNDNTDGIRETATNNQRNNNNRNVGTQSEVLIDAEIQFLQQRLNALQQIQRQLQQRDQQLLSNVPNFTI